MAQTCNSRFVASMAVRYGAELRRFLSVDLRDADEVHALAQKVYERLLRVKNPEAIRDQEAYLFRVAGQVLEQRARKDSPARRRG